MDKLESIILELEDEIAKGKKLFGFTLINKERILSLIESFRTDLPDVVREAENTLKNEARILQEANELSLKRIQQAQETADYLVSTAYITTQAENEARLILEDADNKAYNIETDTKRRIDALLSATESALVNHLNIVRNNREVLSGELLKQYVPLAAAPEEEQ
ncbi:MAG: hypothetical protein LBT30_03060 [Clostridiales bacterium]|jgi:hypothetical protein|nr:hypothetical protein [Clostridiales bacterium]